MKRSGVFLYYGFLVLVMLILQTCKKDELSPEEQLTQQEEKIIDKINDFMPNEVVSSYENSLNNLRNSQDYSLYLDSLETAIDELKSAIQLNYSLTEFQDTLKNCLLNLQNPKKSTMGDCDLRLGYAKGVKIDAQLSGAVGV